MFPFFPAGFEMGMIYFFFLNHQNSGFQNSSSWQKEVISVLLC